MRKAFMAGQVSRQMKSHFWSVQLLTEFPWIIVNAPCSAATGEAGLVCLQQMHLYRGLNYPASCIGLWCWALCCTAGFARGTRARSFGESGDFITKLFFDLGFQLKKEVLPPLFRGEKKKGIVAIKLNAMKNFKDYVANPVECLRSFFQSRVFHLLSNYWAEQRTYFREYIIYLYYG